MLDDKKRVLIVSDTGRADIPTPINITVDQITHRQAVAGKAWDYIFVLGEGNSAHINMLFECRLRDGGTAKRVLSAAVLWDIIKRIDPR